MEQDSIKSVGLDIPAKIETEITQQYRLLVPVLAASGPSGVGKTTTMGLVAQLCGIEDLLTVGKIFRAEMASQGEQVLDGVKRPKSTDQRLNTLIAQQIRTSIRTKKPTLIEARLGPVMVRKFQATRRERKPEEREAVTILLTTINPNIPADRMQGRENELIRHENERRLGTDLPQLPYLTVEQVRLHTKNRQKEDWEAWKLADPDLALLQSNNCPGDDPNWIFNPDDPNGLYDIVLPNDDLDASQTAQELIKKLLHIGAIEPLAA